MLSLTTYNGTQNFLLLTLDSCRWDTFDAACLPVLKKTGAFMQATAQATFTLPAHIAMFSGIFPHVQQRIPYYNRFVRSLFKPDNPLKQADSYLLYPPDSRNAMEGLQRMGYKTIGTGAVEWFTNPQLTDCFTTFHYTGIHAAPQVAWLSQEIQAIERFFGFINFGETHDPYRFGGLIPPSRQSRQRMKDGLTGFRQDLFDQQIASLEFLDGQIETLLQVIAGHSSQTVVIICGDHGECFGEDGCYGHGFYHPIIMNVPLTIFEI